MLVVLALAALAVIAAVVVVAMGRGGELARFAPDVPPLELPEPRRLGAADFLALQLPVSVVGYNTQSVDETLNRVVKALSERDTRIAVLEQQVAELLAGRLQTRHDAGTAPPAMRDDLDDRTGDAAERPQEDVESGGPVEAEVRETAEPLRAVQPQEPANQEPANQEAEAKQPETTTDADEPDKLHEPDQRDEADKDEADKDEAEEPGKPEEAVGNADKDPEASAEGDRTEARGVKEVR
ncbi:hypothetical protein [Streptosporangium saharense]|uniref:hypothetical protein n=1 Tax=Streptosporangium saharense TaxID=1706840 RepID=UPI0033231250